MAGTLWPDRPTKRGLANVRGTLWRLPEVVRAHLATHHRTLALQPQWTVDVDRAVEAARALREHSRAVGIDRDLFVADLLPDWDADWLVLPRERHRQLRLHALEDLGDAQLAADRPLDAVDTAMQAITAEPLRESAQLLLLRAHLAAGNRAAVVRDFRRFRRLLAAELGVDPSPAMREVVDQATSSG